MSDATTRTALAAIFRNAGERLAAQAETRDISDLAALADCIAALLEPTPAGCVPVVKYEPADAGRMED